MSYNLKITDYGDELQISHYEIGVSTSTKHHLTTRERQELNKQAKLACFDKYVVKEEYAFTDVEFSDCMFHELNIEEAKINYVETHFEDFKQRIRSAPADTKDYTELNKARSVRRTIQSIYELTRNNDWNYFATFTFSADWRYDYDTCKDKMRMWFNNFRKRKARIEYLAVPEMHKDGAFHFHALIQGDLSEHLVNGYRKGRYMLPQYKLGIHEIEPVKDRYKAANYITKYITKDLLVVTNHKRRYIYSKGLKKPETFEYNISDDYKLVDFIMNNYPEYTMTHQKIYDRGGYKTQYIQLKKDAEKE